MLELCEEQAGGRPKEALADAGYWSAENALLEDKNTELFIAVISCGVIALTAAKLIGLVRLPAIAPLLGVGFAVQPQFDPIDPMRASHRIRGRTGDREVVGLGRDEVTFFGCGHADERQRPLNGRRGRQELT